MMEIYTDGACSGNPGPGGWGALLRIGTVEIELCGGEPATTNNRVELLAGMERPRFPMPGQLVNRGLPVIGQITAQRFPDHVPTTE